jgi:hypothetical protein
MSQGRYINHFAKMLVLFAPLAIVGGCSDGATAPSNIVAAKAPAGFDRSVGVKAFRVDRRGTNQSIGDNQLKIPAGAICDPALSTYGPGEWDKPCIALTHPITITATVLENIDGEPYVDFQPALRFVPDKEVTLYLRAANHDFSTSMPVIDFCNNLGVCVDESENDPSLATHRVNGRSGMVARRIKHFSGYMINAGRACTDGCDGDGSAMLRRSGYMVASGMNLPAPDLDDFDQTPLDAGIKRNR